MLPTKLADIGVLFDWDGVIIDSSVQHEESWERLALEVQKPLPEGHFKRSFGMKNERIIPEMFRWTEDPAEVKRLSLRKEALYREIVRERGVDALPGVKVFWQRLREAGIPFAVGSSTHRENIDVLMEMLGCSGWFRGIVTSENVKEGKPHPAVFQQAAATLGLDPRCCVVFEDAPVGIQAARAAGCRVVGVATTHPAEALRSSVDRVVRQLDELQPDDLLALWTR